jgi:type IV fimbrial biogenesis protein FimT
MEIALKVHPSEQRSSGFTMLELVIVIAIVGVLIALGVPSFKYVTTANRIASEVNGLMGDMQFARAEAIKEGQTVVVCVSSNGTSCTNSPWNNGWIVCSDPANDSSCDAGVPIYRVQKPFTSTDTFVAGGNTDVLTFNRDGFAVGLAGAVTIALHNAPVAVTAYTRCLAISAVGTLVVQASGTGACL